MDVKIVKRLDNEIDTAIPDKAHTGYININTNQFLNNKYLLSMIVSIYLKIDVSYAHGRISGYEGKCILNICI